MKANMKQTNKTRTEITIIFTVMFFGGLIFYGIMEVLSNAIVY
jgi:hypothetical protein